MISQFVFNPLISIGEIKFGMERSKVRKILGSYSEYKNRPSDDNTFDFFDICQVFYNKNNNVKFIMFHELSAVELKWNDKILNQMKPNELISLFRSLDTNLIIETNNISIESNKLGVACYFVRDIVTDNNGKQNEIERVETISFAVENFWK